MTSIRSASPMPATVAGPRFTTNRPACPWQQIAAGELRVKNPSVIRGWAEDYPPRVTAMLRAMVKAGVREQAEAWMADFETAFIAVPDDWTGTWRAAVLADAAEDIKRDDFHHDNSPEGLRHYAVTLRKEIAAKQRKLRAVDARLQAVGQ